MEKKKRYFLAEEDIPRYWYNIQADMVNKPMPPLNPATKQPLKPEDLYPIFAEELSLWGHRPIYTSRTKASALSARTN